MVVTISLSEFVADQMWYNLESAQYLWQSYYVIIIIIITTDHLISARRPDLIVINKKKKMTCKIVDFVVPSDHRIKLKECEKKD